MVREDVEVDQFPGYLKLAPTSEHVEFVYDVKNNTFAVGKPKPYVNLTGLPHQKLAASIGVDATNIVAGMFRRGAAGQIML